MQQSIVKNFPLTIFLSFYPGCCEYTYKMSVYQLLQTVRLLNSGQILTVTSVKNIPNENMKLKFNATNRKLSINHG